MNGKRPYLSTFLHSMGYESEFMADSSIEYYLIKADDGI